MAKKKASKTSTRRKSAAGSASSVTGQSASSTQSTGRKASKPDSATQPAVQDPTKSDPGENPPGTFEEREVALTEAQLRKVKTDLTRKDLAEFKKQLLQKRAELLGDVASLETDALNSQGTKGSHVPLHMADVGSDNYEQEFTLGLVESESKLLREIDEALLRIQNHTYGVCIDSGQPISRARLNAKPWAKYCIEVAREKERSGKF